jgi:hypothetical protein
MRATLLRSGALAALLLLAPALLPRAVQAQEWRDARRLEQRLDPPTTAEVMRIADSAYAVGIPAGPLVDKALEGAARRAEGRRIVEAVRGLVRRMGDARDVLGARSSESDLVAAAGAIQQGVPAAELARLRYARRDGSLALPLVVLGDLIERGVPVSTAISVVLQVAGTGADDAAFAALRRDVEQDIAAGAPPAIAAATRARGAVFATPSGAVGRPAVAAPVAAELSGGSRATSGGGKKP